MKIKVLGFQWKMFGNATLADLRRALDAEAVRRHGMLSALLTTGNSGGWDGIYYAIVDEGPFWVGLVLKVRDQKQFCQVSGASGVLRLSAQALAAGSKMAEVNFFLVHPATGKGLYQYYHLSTWPASFGYLCKRILDADVLQRCSAIETQGQENLWAEKKIRSTKKAIQGTMTPELIVRKEGFDQLVDALSHIDLVRLSIRDDSIKVSQMGALSSAARHMNVQFTYGKDSKIDALQKAVKDVATRVQPWKMRVEGQTTDGRSAVVNLIENPDAFDEMDFDVATAGLDLDLNNPAASLHVSPIIKRLTDLAATPRLATMLRTN